MAHRPDLIGDHLRTAGVADFSLCSLRKHGSSEPKLSKSDKIELLEASRAGRVVELELDIVATLEPEKPSPLPLKMRSKANANYTRFRSSDMPTFARSFKGRPFLADHDRQDMLRVGGRITRSEMDEDGVTMRQTVLLVKPWAVEAALDGTMLGFSIGWDPKRSGQGGFLESAFCTVCDSKMFSLDCSHYPGDIVELEGGSKVLCELEWRNVRGAETSAVTFPAVQGTGVEEISQALSEARRSLPSNKPQKETTMNLAEMAAMLGLASDATEAQIKVKLAENNAQLAAAQEVAAQKTSELATIAAQKAADDAAAKAGKLAALKAGALAKGLWVPNDKRDILFNQLAATSLESAEQFVAALEPIVPVGSGPQVDPMPTGAQAATEVSRILADEYLDPKLTEDGVIMAHAKLGLSREDFLAHGQHTRDANYELEKALGKVVR